MKNKYLSILVLTFFFIVLSPAFASASKHNNKSHDYEVHVVYYASGGVLVPFSVGTDITMNITVSYPGKIITYEDIYAYIVNGALFPFECSLNVGTIKYYKDGSYWSTHSLPYVGSYIADPNNITGFRYGKPNTDLVDSSTYKAIGAVTYSSSSTTPMSFVVDTTEGVVD